MVFMMKRIISLAIVFTVLIACNDRKAEKGLELEILSEEFICYSGDEYHFFSDEYQKKYLTKYKYKVTNNSNKKYILNLDASSNYLYKKREYFNYKDVLVFTSENDSLEVYSRIRNFIDKDCRKDYYDYIERNLGNRFLNIEMEKPYKINSFLLNHGETKYIENYVILPFGDEFNHNSIKLKSKSNYFVTVKIWSDSTRLKEVFDDSELRTFKENGYEFYHGVVSSKNKVPLKLIE
jgi:hypothetical protein